ncbi:MAG: hypothetical protein FD149_1951 [Rhodospirillaceae bacterium]|nr:MAG: hypothetical protein FD149_1951 [Rhodospirillaceae bacterium]
MKILRLKLAIVALVLCMPLLAWGAQFQVVDIDVQGMTCPFCAYGLSKSLTKASEVDSADASLKEHKVRIVLKPGAQPDLDRYKKLIHEAGFTPGDARVSMEEVK